ncbi:MAG TPA: hypothetical protein VHL79_15585 [Ramlibacter sp.]|jgi:hypothetical protein|nr:hypothetical protein [Ramlibacter sp.]
MRKASATIVAALAGACLAAGVDPARQGFPREQSAAMLDAQVRQLLDGVLALYMQDGLFTDRTQVLQAIGVTQTLRRWRDVRPPPGKHRSYVDAFTAGGAFQRPGWSGEYAFSTDTADPATWHASVRISIDPKTDCLDSRAVEGYLDLDLDPGIRQQVHPAPERLHRHVVDFARPFAPPRSATTPQLSLSMGKGCVTGIGLAKILRFDQVSDARSGQPTPPEAEVLVELQRLAFAGGADICNAALLEERLGIRIGQRTEFFREHPFLRSQWTENIAAAPGKPALKYGRFERIRGANQGVCELRLQYEGLQFCDTPRGRLKNQLGIEPLPGAPMPHGTRHGYEYWFTSADGGRTVLLLGSSDGPCTDSFVLSAGSDWN